MARKSKNKNKKGTMASAADKFSLYQRSVQHADHEVQFFEQAYREEFKAKPYVLREDFCGTFAVCCEWAKSNKKRTALGVDLCAETLKWGKEHNLSQLSKSQRARVEVIEQDVRKTNEPKVDVLAAQNFSFWIFKTRKEVIEYFRTSRENIDDKGIMVMDMMGGGGCYEVDQVDKRTIVKGKGGFKYHWEQRYFNPVTRDCTFHISFKFPDGSKLKRAFTYEWRFWTIPEVREMLEEAGFRASYVYWEEEDEDGEDTGEWKKAAEAPSHESWVCYIVAVK